MYSENTLRKLAHAINIHVQRISDTCIYPPARRFGSNEYPQSIFETKIRKIKLYPCKPHFHNEELGFKGGILFMDMFSL